MQRQSRGTPTPTGLGVTLSPPGATCPPPAALLAQGQYSRFEGITYPEPVQYSQYDQQSGESPELGRGFTHLPLHPFPLFILPFLPKSPSL